MHLTVLGNSNRYLSPLGVGLSYLLSADGTDLVVDCANGTALRLEARLRGRAASGLVLPHFHVESLADVVPVVEALPSGAPVFVPSGSMPEVRRLLVRRAERGHVKELTFREVTEGSEAFLGPFTLRFARARHGCHGVAVRASAGGESVAFLGDTGPMPGLRSLAHGADLVVAHTLLLDRDAGDGAGVLNLTAGAAARLAAEAGARRVALAHQPFYAEARESLAEATRHFAGDVFVLREGETYAVAAGAPVPEPR